MNEIDEIFLLKNMMFELRCELWRSFEENQRKNGFLRKVRFKHEDVIIFAEAL
jgi:hypothetical protein